MQKMRGSSRGENAERLCTLPLLQTMCMIAINKSTKTNTAGGSAGAGGFSFQASVTAIAMVQMARGAPLGWLEGLISDIPLAVSAESAGPGDDIRLELESNMIVEVQVKQGFSAGKKLWESLLALAAGIRSKSISFGVLVLCPNSSGSIRRGLAQDISRIGWGRKDDLSELGHQFVTLLETHDYDAQAVCGSIRIITVQALSSDNASINAARAELGHICINPSAAWMVLDHDGLSLIKMRGRRTIIDVGRLLKSHDIQLRSDLSIARLNVLAKVAEWVRASNVTFSVFGIPNALPLDSSWIKLEAAVLEEPLTTEKTLEGALKRYHSSDGGSVARAQKTDAATLGRYVRQCVLIAGPGMGKTTLLRVLSRSYADDGFPVLSVRLPMVAVRMRERGASFEESVVSLGLGGSGISENDVRYAGMHEVILLCDGLDECGHQQAEIAKALAGFSIGHPRSRIIVTTRPIGYDCAELLGWRHYQLLPLNEYDASTHVAKLLGGVLDTASEAFESKLIFAKSQLSYPHVKRVAARSPMLLGFIAALSLRDMSIGESKGDLYRQLFRLIEDAPGNRPREDSPTSAVMVRMLEILGFTLISHPNQLCTAAIGRCAQTLASEMGVPLLRARELADICAVRWQDLGMLERVRFGADEVITFIHKTFGEYAAARYLVNMAVEERNTHLAEYVNEPGWAEVIRFASALGLVEFFVKAVLASTFLHRDPTLIERAIKWVLEAEPKPCVEVINNLIEAAWTFVNSERRSFALRVGESLCELARIFPSEIAKGATPYLQSNAQWTKLVAWACAINAESQYDYAEMLEILADIESLNREPKQLSGGFNFRRPGADIARHFVMGAARRILARKDSEADLCVLEQVVKTNTLQSTTFVSEICALFRSHGLEQPINIPLELTRSFLTKEHITLWREEHINLLDLLDVPTQSSDQEDDREPSKGELLALSAFLDASGYQQLNASDVGQVRGAEETNLTRALIQVVFSVSNIDPATVARAARLRRKTIHKSADVFTSIFTGLPLVDTQPNWALAKETGISLETLERSMMTGSQWVVLMAAQILGNTLPVSELANVLQRLMAYGKGMTLWATASLTGELPPEQKASLLLERLSKPIFPGSQHLYAALVDLDSKYLTGLSLDALRPGLLGTGPRTAIAAAKLAGKGLHLVDLDALISEAYDFWIRNEEPYPKESGAVPDSPRAELTKCAIELNLLSDTEILKRCSDERSDVQESSQKALEIRLQQSEECRDGFLNALESGDIAPRFLSYSLQKLSPYSEPQVKRIFALLTSTQSKIRYSAMELLRPKYGGSSEIKLEAERLLTDPEMQIREKAAELLSKCHELWSE